MSESNHARDFHRMPPFWREVCGGVTRSTDEANGLLLGHSIQNEQGHRIYGQRFVGLHLTLCDLVVITRVIVG
jgi:hypothetical protein